MFGKINLLSILSYFLPHSLSLSLDIVIWYPYGAKSNDETLWTQIYLHVIQLYHKLYYTINRDYNIHKCGTLTKHTNDINEKKILSIWKLLGMYYTGCNKLECDPKYATSKA